MILDILEKHIESLMTSSMSAPKKIILNHEQYIALQKDLMKTQNFVHYIENAYEKRIFTYKGIPILCSDISDLKCRFCDKEALTFEYNGAWLCSCNEHMNKTKMFYLLSLGGKNEL